MIENQLLLGNSLFLVENDQGLSLRFLLGDSFAFDTDPTHAISLSRSGQLQVHHRDLNDQERQTIFGGDGRLQRSDGRIDEQAAGRHFWGEPFFLAQPLP